MLEKKPFRVVDDAVQYVAGQRVPDSRIMLLTEATARYDVLSGVLVPADMAHGDANEADAPRRRAPSKAE